MSSFEDYFTDESFVEAFRATYDGRHDPVDALYWLDHPAEPGPSGADAPAADLAELKRAAYSRHADGAAEQALRALERELATDRDETLAAIVRARNPRPVASEPFQAVEADTVAEVPARRRWPVVVAAVAAIGIAIVWVRLAVPEQGPVAQPEPTISSNPSGPSVATNSYVAYTPTPRATDTGTGTPVSCANLVDVSTYLIFGGQGLTEVTSRLTEQNAPQALAKIPIGHAVAGVSCAWSDSTSSFSEVHIKALYDYDVMDSDTQERAIADLESRGFRSSTSGDITRYTQGEDDYAFGDGFQVYTESGDFDLLDQLVAHVPEMADEPRTDLQSAVYVTSEGLGDLRIGQSIPSSSKLAAWNPTACNAHRGAWLARSPFAVRSDGYGTVYGLVTDDGARNGKLDRIMIYSPAIPTKSGIRVGDSEAKLKATFDEFADGGPYVLTGDVGKIAFELSSYDPEHPEAQVVVAIWVVPKGDELPSWGTDANGPCPA